MAVKLLIVEDHPDVRRGLEKGLRLAGYTIDVAVDGTEGEYYIRNFEYGGIILDIMLPGKNGMELLEIVRELGDTPVLMLSAKDGVEDRVAGLEQGADDYLVKPFSYDELKARVKALLRRSMGAVTKDLVCGAVRVDSKKKEVYLEDVRVELTSGEYSVLETLMLKKDEVVSRSYLYEQIGEISEDGFSNAIDVMICKIRRKLGKSLIETRRGQGYIIH